MSPDNIPRVLVVSHSYTAMENLKNLRELSRHCRVKAVLYKVKNDVQTEESDVSDSIDVNLEIRYGKKYEIAGSQYLLSGIYSTIRRQQPHIIHVEYDPWSLIFIQTWLCAKLALSKAVFVCTVKKNTFRRYRGVAGLVKSTVSNFFIKKVSAFIAVNEGVRSIYLDRFNVPTKKIHKSQHLGVDTALFSTHGIENGADDSGVVIGYVGALEKRKGVDLLVDAVAELRSTANVPVRLKLLGEGSLPSESLGESGDTSWLEIMPSVPHREVAFFLDEIDVFVMPSIVLADHEEHDGHAVMEAMACGLAVIASDSGVLPELVSQDVGLIYDWKEPAQLVRHLNTLIQNPEMIGAFGVNARQVALKNFSLERIAEKKAKIYRELLSK